MAVKLRLMRMGKKKQPTYRVVAADSRKARNGRIIEAVGFYDPRRDPSVIEIDNEKAVGWLRNGAQPTERVEKLLKITGAWDEFKGQPVGTSFLNFQKYLFKNICWDNNCSKTSQLYIILY